ncbi:hypothetical protein [Pseudomonas sp. WS 5414]|nr:hypothetical protein [Pseudomonas sp. WS 5414]NMY70148.1 hypothetical protein [Pseudomonas sp. WS 5414]
MKQRLAEKENSPPQENMSLRTANPIKPPSSYTATHTLFDTIVQNYLIE